MIALGKGNNDSLLDCRNPLPTPSHLPFLGNAQAGGILNEWLGTGHFVICRPACLRQAAWHFHGQGAGR